MSEIENKNITIKKEIDRFIQWTKDKSRVNLPEIIINEEDKHRIKDVLKENDPQGEVDELIIKINNL